jgi:uncharacterized protein YecT (DUF1311 family)
MDCAQATTTAAMRASENARYEDAERNMNAAYADLRRMLDAQRQRKLKNAQLAWLRFREANAEFYRSAAEGGTLAPFLRTGTLADMTEARAAELRRALPP